MLLTEMSLIEVDIFTGISSVLPQYNNVPTSYTCTHTCLILKCNHCSLRFLVILYRGVCVWGGGGIRLIVGFQPLVVISPTASWIRWCMQVYAGVCVVI